jgi:stage IV sporulation protein B
MKKLLKIAILTVLFTIYIYLLAIESIPDSVVIFEGEKLNIKTILGLSLKSDENYDAILASSSIDSDENNEIGTTKVSVNLFDKISIKDVSVSVLPTTTVIPVGSIAGVKLYTNGVLVVGMSEVEDLEKQKVKPYENSGIEEGDTIITIGEREISNTQDLIQTVNESNGATLNITYVRNGETQECSITPVETSSKEYKIGLWVRDSAAGVGTVSFYEPSTKMFGALGHGITDIDTGELINISNGEFITTKILSIIRGEQGTPGKIQGTVENQKNIGDIYKNTEFGIYGKVNNIASLNIDSSKEMEVALRDEIKEGEATILCSLDGETPKEYKIEIEKIYKENNYDNKSMLIKVTDDGLIEKTGGIIQGMSGSPIIQNGKFVGAITHVLVNSPEEGYAVFGDLMIKQMRSTN